MKYKNLLKTPLNFFKFIRIQNMFSKFIRILSNNLRKCILNKVSDKF